MKSEIKNIENHFKNERSCENVSEDLFDNVPEYYFERKIEIFSWDHLFNNINTVVPLSVFNKYIDPIFQHQ